MNPEEFKQKWSPDKLNNWLEFDENELAKSPLKEETKLFLKNGFPRGAAPFLGFGMIDSDNKFHNIYDYYQESYEELDKKTKNYWIFGSDGNGDLICFDTSRGDRILLLSHDSVFEIIDEINISVAELAQCLLFFKEFIQQIRTELGDDAFMKVKYSTSHVLDLRQRFLSINPNIFIQSSFWNNAIERL
jgi:SUKH-4 immunity protein